MYCSVWSWNRIRKGTGGEREGGNPARSGLNLTLAAGLEKTRHISGVGGSGQKYKIRPHDGSIGDNPASCIALGG